MESDAPPRCLRYSMLLPLGSDGPLEGLNQPELFRLELMPRAAPVPLGHQRSSGIRVRDAPVEALLSHR
jgi:hypothetical protein